MMPGTILPQSLVENYLFNRVTLAWKLSRCYESPSETNIATHGAKGKWFLLRMLPRPLGGSHLLLGSGSLVQEAEVDQTGQS